MLLLTLSVKKLVTIIKKTCNSKKDVHEVETTQRQQENCQHVHIISGSTQGSIFIAKSKKKKNK